MKELYVGFGYQLWLCSLNFQNEVKKLYLQWDVGIS